jgi:hypothetical protein
MDISADPNSSRNTKLKLHKILIREILIYRSEACTRTMEQTKVLRIYERETGRKIHEPVREGERWIIRTRR